ncbi:hypothetical protein ACN6LM_007014 [Streptomyces sp. SAS_281]|uniref:hypothetical protein n=1 Tax=Streptomyces sp. SAS_281 TaxID=3412744 RepID=UPI00403CD84B
MEYLVEAGERDGVSVQVAQFGVGLHALTDTDVMFLRPHLHRGRLVVLRVRREGRNRGRLSRPTA